MRSVGGPVQGHQDDKGRKDLWPCFRIPRFQLSKQAPVGYEMRQGTARRGPAQRDAIDSTALHALLCKRIIASGGEKITFDLHQPWPLRPPA